jgi:hypothetical protein
MCYYKKIMGLEEKENEDKLPNEVIEVIGRTRAFLSERLLSERILPKQLLFARLLSEQYLYELLLSKQFLSERLHIA